MSEMSASTNVEAGSAASDSGTGSSAEAGMSGPTEAADQTGTESAANDNNPQAANDNTVQAEPASDANDEATGYLAAAYAPEAGEVGPPEVGEEVPGSSPQEIPESVNEAAEPVNEVPEPVNEVPDEVPANDTAPQPEASQTTMSAAPWTDRTIRPDFDKAADPKVKGDEQGDGKGGKQKTDPIGLPELVPGPSPRKKDEPHP